jgi:hypothetical protein
MYLSLQGIKLKLEAEKKSGTSCLDPIVPEDWMAELVADDVYISIEMGLTVRYIWFLL